MKRKVMSKSNRIFYIVNTVLLMICLLLVAMPILNVVASSLSSPSAVIRGQVSFWPKDGILMHMRRYFPTGLF